MYDPTRPSSTTATAAAPATARPRREQGVLDKVKVAPETFKSVLFMGSAVKREFTEANMPNRDKPQKVDTATGLPVWSVKFAAITWQGASDLLTVNIPMPDDPAQKFTPGQPVELVGHVLGITTKRSGSYSIWQNADGINPLAA